MTNTKSVEEIYEKAKSKTKDELIYLLVTTIKEYEENYTPNTSIQQSNEEAVKEYSKWFTRYFQEGHKYIAWVENGELKIVDENHIELNEDMLNDEYKNFKQQENHEQTN